MPFYDWQQRQAVTNMPLPCLFRISDSCRHRAWAHVMSLTAWSEDLHQRTGPPLTREIHGLVDLEQVIHICP